MHQTNMTLLIALVVIVTFVLGFWNLIFFWSDRKDRVLFSTGLQGTFALIVLMLATFFFTQPFPIGDVWIRWGARILVAGVTFPNLYVFIQCCSFVDDQYERLGQEN